MVICYIAPVRWLEWLLAVLIAWVVSTVIIYFCKLSRPLPWRKRQRSGEGATFQNKIKLLFLKLEMKFSRNQIIGALILLGAVLLFLLARAWLASH